MLRKFIVGLIFIFAVMAITNVVFADETGIIYGDADNNGKITVNDASDVLQKVLNSAYQTKIDEEKPENSKTVMDVTADGKLTATDAASILQKALDSSFIFPVERIHNETEDLTETTTESGGNGEEESTEINTENMDIFEGGAVASNTILDKDTYCKSDLEVKSNLDLNGHTFVIDGDLIQPSGIININNGTLVVKKNYRMQIRETNENGEPVYGDSKGFLQMIKENDYVLVGGNFYAYNNYSTGPNSAYTYLSNGLLEIKGDFYQGGSENVFYAGENHKIKFSGEEEHIVSFENCTYHSGFGSLYESSKIVCVTPISIKSLASNISADILMIGDGDFNLNGYTLTVSEDLIQSGGIVNINKGILEVQKDYRIQTKETDKNGEAIYRNSKGFLQMTNENDYVLVNGNFYAYSDYSTGPNSVYAYLTNGLLEIKGDFYQGGSENVFYTEENHKVKFSGEKEHIVSFENCTYRSGFGSLYESSKIVCVTPVSIKSLASDISADTLMIGDGDFNLNGHSFTITNDLIQSGGKIIVNKGVLEIQKDYRIQTKETDENGEPVYGDSKGFLQMTNENDYVLVNGNFYAYSDYSTGPNSVYAYLTNGLLEIKGDFYQGGSENVFYTEENHKVKFSGEKEHIVSFENCTYRSGFGSLYESSKIVCVTPVSIKSLASDISADTLMIGDGDFNLNGHSFTITNDLIQSGGKIIVNKGVLEIQKDYRIQTKETDENGEPVYGDSKGFLQMTNENDYVLVNGNFYAYSDYSTGPNSVYAYLTNGLLEIKGDFYQGGSENVFYTEENHKVKFSGEKEHIVSFENCTYRSGFGSLYESSKIVCVTPVSIKSLASDISADTLMIGDGDFNLNGHSLTITNDLIQSGGKIIVNKGILEVQGDYRIQTKETNENEETIYSNSKGRLLMTNEDDYVLVHKNFYVYGEDEAYSTLWNGLLEIQGDFHQGGYDHSFYSTSNHITLLSGKNKQSVKFESCYNDDKGNMSGYSHFNILIINKPKESGYSFSPARCWNYIEYRSDINIHLGKSGGYAPTGNYSQTFSDLDIAAPGVSLAFGRTYNSSDETGDKLMGKGWRFSYSSSIETGEDYAVVTMPNGSTRNFIFDGNVYKATNSLYKLENTGNGFTMSANDGSKIIFNKNGYMIAVSDKYGNTVSINVDSSGVISSLTDQAGNTYTVKYSGGLISKITDSLSGRSVQYLYRNGQLAEFVDTAGCSSYYLYDENGKLSEIQNSECKVVQKTEYITDSESDYNGRIASITDVYGNTSVYEYDLSGRKTTITDSNGRKTIQRYDINYNVTSTTDPEGGVETKTYYSTDEIPRAAGEIKSMTDRNGGTVSYERDGNGNILKTTFPDGGTETFQYNNKNNITKEVDKEGRATFYVYDDSGIYVRKVVQDINGISSYNGNDSDYAVTAYEYYPSGTYKANGLKKKEVSPLGTVTEYDYFNDGLLKSIKISGNGANSVKTYTYNNQRLASSITDSNGNVTEYEYDSRDNKIKETRNNGKSTAEYVYNKKGELTEEILPNGGSVKYTYNECSLPVSKTDARGNITTFTYDIYGNKITETQPNKAVYKYEYDNLNRVIRKSLDGAVLEETKYKVISNGNTEIIKTVYTDSNTKQTTTQKFDYASRLTKQVNPDGTEITNTYDKTGLKTSSSDHNGNIAYYTYNKQGLLTEKKIPFEIYNGTMNYQISKYTYDKQGNVLTELCSANKVGEAELYTKKEYEYDGLNRLVKVVNYDNSDTLVISQYYYDGCGNMARKYTGLNKPLTVNGLDSVTENGDSDYSIDKYEYDYMGNVTKHTDPMGYTESYSYTPDGLVETYTDKNGNTISFEYDENGNMKTEKSSDFSYSFLSDVMNNRKFATGGEYTLNYTFDKQLRVIEETDGNGVVKKYSYDNLGNMLSRSIVKNDVYAINETFTYDSMNRIKIVSDSGKLKVSYEYDKNGNIIKITYGNGVVSEYTYNVGNYVKTIRAKSADGTLLKSIDYDYYTNANVYNDGRIYEYDGLGRIKTVSDDTVTNYAYDDYSNILSVTGGDMTTAYSYDKNSRMLSVSENDVLSQYSYDQNGNMLSVSKNGVKTNYAYNTLNNLITVNDSGNVYSYKYDYDNMRIEKNINGNITRHIWSGDNILAETDDKGNITASYNCGVGRIAYNDNYYINNARNDVVGVVNSDGTVKEYNYDTFGKEVMPNKNDTNPFRYCGEYYDNETDNIYLRARYYSPKIRRFISEDKNSGDNRLSVTLNKYTYCNNNPVTYVDFSGNEAEKATLGGFIYEELNAFGQDSIDNKIDALVTGEAKKVSMTEKVVSSGKTFVTTAASYGFSIIESEAKDIINPSIAVKPFISETYSLLSGIATGEEIDPVKSLVKIGKGTIKGAASAIGGKATGTAVGIVLDIATNDMENNREIKLIAGGLKKALEYKYAKREAAREYWFNTYVDPNYEKIGYNNVVCGWSDILQMGDWLEDTAKSGSNISYNNWIEQNGRRKFNNKY